MNRAIAVLLGLVTAAGLGLYLATQLKDKPGQDLPVQEEGTLDIAREKLEAQERAVASLEKERDALARELEGLREENASLEERIRRLEGDAGESAPGAARPSVEESVPVAEADAASAEAEPATERERWAVFAERLLAMGKMAQEQQDKPTAELMQAFAKFMGDVASLQKELGLEEPGFVTSSPKFKAHMLAAAMEAGGTPLDPAEKEMLLASADKAQENFLEAARGEEGEFALGRLREVIQEDQAFDSKLKDLLGDRRPKGVGFSLSLGKGEETPDSTPWPEQFQTGAQDLDGAADAIAHRWRDRMGLPEHEAALVRQIARDYVELSHAAKLRRDAAGKRNLDPETLRRLDRELSGYQLEALRRLHDTLNLDEETRKKVRAYRSFDRYLLGDEGSWSRSGSYGGFMVNAEADEEG